MNETSRGRCFIAVPRAAAERTRGLDAGETQAFWRLPAFAVRVLSGSLAQETVRIHHNHPVGEISCEPGG